MARKDAVQTFHTSSNKRHDSISPDRSLVPHSSTRSRRGSMDSCERDASAADDCTSRPTTDKSSFLSPPAVKVGASLNASAKIFEPRTAEAVSQEQQSVRECSPRDRSSAETRLPSSASTVYPNSNPSDHYVAPYCTGSPAFAGEWYHSAEESSSSQVWHSDQNEWTSSSPFAHQLDIIQDFSARANEEALNVKAALAGTHVEIYLGETFLQKVSSWLLLRFSSVARQILNSRPCGERQRIILHATSSELPSMKALLEVVRWMRSTNPHQTDKEISSFGSVQVDALPMTDLLDMYTAICTFGLEPRSAWQNLWEELTCRIRLRPPLVTALRTFHACLCNSDPLMHILLTRAYEGYRTREYTVTQWLAVKAYLLDSDDLPFQVEAVSTFQHARRYHGDAECIECVTEGWQVRGRRNSDKVEVRLVEREEGLYCAEHAADGHKLTSVARAEDVGGTIRPSAARVSGEERALRSQGRRRCRRAQQRQGKEKEEAATTAESSPSVST